MPLSIATRVERLAAREGVVGYSCDPKRDYWYREGQLLVHQDDLGAAREVLEELRARPLGLDEYRFLDELGPPVARFQLPRGVSVPAAVARLRRVPAQRVRALPNHVFGAFPHHFFPGSVPIATKEEVPLGEVVTDSPIRTVVVDTGLIIERDGGRNPQREAHEQLALDAAHDDEPLDVEPRDGMLDDADAHGGFIVDLIRQLAPEVEVRGTRALVGGLADELQLANDLARAVAQSRPQIVNLSLGGYTDDDHEPMVLSDTIRKLDPAPVLVAAAGNNGRSRPTWPAAFNEVIGVGAVHEPTGYGERIAPPRPAEFSNHGCWVDACALGVDVLSTYVRFQEQAPVPGTHQIFDAFPSPQEFLGAARWSGTSFAAPRVAARIADLALQLHRDQGADPLQAARIAAAKVIGGAATSVADLGAYVA